MVLLNYFLYLCQLMIVIFKKRKRPTWEASVEKLATLCRFVSRPLLKMVKT